MPPTPQKSGKARARLVLPVFLLGVTIAGIGFMLRNRAPRVASAEEVHTRIHDVVMQGGFIGPLFVTSREYDPATGQFHDFHAQTDSLRVAAQRATLRVNSATDTFTFDLDAVGIISVPEKGQERPVVFRDRYLLGPFPLAEDVVDPPGIHASNATD